MIRILTGDCREVMASLEPASVDSIVTDLALGIAAEHLVCADLLLAGFSAFRTEQLCPYDIAVDTRDRLIRVQVKATRGPRSIPQRVGHFPAYMWHVRRAGKGGARLYAIGEFDVLALVAMDCRRIAYLKPEHARQTIHIRPDDHRPTTCRPGKRFDDFPFAGAL